MSNLQFITIPRFPSPLRRSAAEQRVLALSHA